MNLLDNIDFHFRVLDALNNKKIDPETDCWIYTGEIDKCVGYGRVMIFGVRYHIHRLSAAQYLGLDLNNSEQFSCHLCSNRACFNPKHLYVGDNRSNQLDKVADRCKKGHALTENNILINKTSNKNGGYREHRLCRICHKERTKKGHEKKKEENQLIKEVLRDIKNKTIQ